MASETLRELCKRPVTDVQEFFEQFPRHVLDKLRKGIAMAIDHKYNPHKYRHPRYGDLPQSMSDEMLVNFFSTMTNKEHRRFFLKQFFYALRISEVNSCTLDKETGFVKIIDKKKHDRVEYMPFIEGTESLFEPFNDGEGYSHAYMERMFARQRERLGGEWMFSYATAEGGSKQYLWTDHVFRKSAAKRFYEFTKSEFKTEKFLRHDTQKRFGHMGAYVSYTVNEMGVDANAVLGKYVKLLL